ASASATNTIWPSTAAPAVLDVGPDTPVELGVSFKADVNGYITGIRFYKSSSNTGTHVGNLWSSTGQLLASATFTNETASGWQQVNFANPVAVTANTVYVASYHSTIGHWSADWNFFASSGVDNAPLHALANVSGTPDGRFTYGSGSAFPTSTNTANYWVDVAFTPVSTPPSTNASTIWPSSAVPAVADVGADSGVELGVSFKADVNGYIAGVRFYKSSSNTGTHVGNLWSSTGQLLASATFTNETASGWQQVNFANPVAVTANTVYVASYHSTIGHWSADWNFFASSGVDNAPLHALANVSGTPDGRFTYGSGSAFPTSTNTANYWVDVAFTPVSTPPSTNASTIWPSSAVPAVADVGADSGVELGVSFKADVNGYIAGVRFYKSAANTGTHVGNLWSSTGTLLASATFTNETASGWQQVNFANPVAVTANTVYVASYHSTIGHWSADWNFFASSGVDNAPLHALANVSGTPDGRFTYGSGSAFPTSTNTANYWVDVAFTPVSSPPSMTPSTTWPSSAVPAAADVTADSGVEPGVSVLAGLHG